MIVDLSLGTESVLQFCSERIVNHILNDAARRFASGQDPAAYRFSSRRPIACLIAIE